MNIGPKVRTGLLVIAVALIALFAGARLSQKDLQNLKLANVDKIQLSAPSNSATGADAAANTEVGNTNASQALRDAFERRQLILGAALELRCFTKSRFDCSADGCTPSEPKTFFFVDHGTEGGTYFRCDEKGCDDYPVTVGISGAFKTFLPKTLGAASFLKLSTLDNSFVDVATSGTGMIVSYGTCR